MDAYIGSILPVAFRLAPYGWNYCGGQSLTIAQNNALYALIGITYGGDARTNFNVPNLTSRIPLGASLMGNAPNLTQEPIGTAGGSEQAIIAHTHPGSFNPAGVTVNLPQFNANVTTTTHLMASGDNGAQPAPSANSYLAGFTGNTDSQEGVNGKLYSAGSSTPANLVNLGGLSCNATATVTPAGATTLGGSSALTVGVNASPAPAKNSLPPFLAISFIIALQGIFPTPD